MSIEEFKENLHTKDLKYVYRKFLLGHRVWYFESKAGKEKHAEIYDDFKIYMSNKLDIHFNNIAIVGSAKLGFSLSPNKKFNTFNQNSDIDLVLVSNLLFRQSWDAFIDLSTRFHIPNYKQITSNVFRRFISLKNPDIRNEFFKKWSKKINPCKKDLQTIFEIPHDINYRIYESWKDVERYHIAGLEAIKNTLEPKDA